MRRRKLTEDERKQHKREAQRRWREKKKINKAFWDEFENMNPDLYPTKVHLDDDQKEFIRNMLNRPVLSVEKKIKNDSKAKRQIGLARASLKRSSIGSIDFDMKDFTKEDYEYFWRNVPDVIDNLLDKIDLDDHWTVYYQYDGSWKQRTLDSITQTFLKDQIRKELKDNESYIIYSDEINSGDSFFPLSIRALEQIRFVNEDEVGLRGRANNNKLTRRDFRSQDAYNTYLTLLKTKASKKVLNTFLSKTIRTKRGGKFWKWYNLLPELNLERYMIFNKLDSRTAAQVERDNCFIYACRMHGVNEQTLNDMRYCIHKRSFGMVDIKNISSELGLSFIISTGEKNIKIGNGDNPIEMILMNNHYMLNEKVSVTPYYIRHREEIIKNPSIKYWHNSDIVRIQRILPNGECIRTTKKYSIRKILNTMFECNYFKPITSNQFMVFNSLISIENLDPISSLEYNVEYCCKLKASHVNI